MSDNKKGSSLTEWTEQLSFHLDKLRENVDKVRDFSLQDSLQTSWDNVKALPPTLADARTVRNTVPPALLDEVCLPDFAPHIRAVGRARLPLDFGEKTINVLTLSSGGAKGAYGAGLMSGWADSGNLPDFDVMMGVSTGAVIALAAFVGRFEALRYFYTEFSTDDLVEKQVLQGIAKGTAGLYDNAQFVAQLAGFIDEVFVKQLADEGEKGRALLVGTTNLDRRLPVTWDLTAIARSNHPLARQLIIDVVAASCAIPVVFPPVSFTVSDAAGNEYQELHTDGAAAQQLLIHIPAQKARVFAVINKHFANRYDPVKYETFDIAMKSLNAALGSAMTGDIYRLYLNTTRYQHDFAATWIPDSFSMQPTALFDRDYMCELFALGETLAKNGQAWHDVPPFFED